MPPRSLNEPSTCRRRQWNARHPARPEGDRRAATSYVGRPASSSAVPTLHHSAAREDCAQDTPQSRSEEHTSELQSLMRISYAVFCLKKKKTKRKRKISGTHAMSV